MINHTDYLDFLFTTGLSQSQFLLLYLIYKKDQDNINRYKERFPTEDGTMIGKYLTQQLIDEGWMILDSKKNLKLTYKFRQYFVIKETALNELLDIYPPFVDKEGVNIPLVTVDKYQYSLKYNRRILKSVKEHDEVLKDLQYGIDKGYIRFGIAKFIDAEMWKPLRKLRLKEDTESVQLDVFDEDF